MIENINVDTIANAGMGVSFIVYLIYDRQVVLKQILKGFIRLETKVDDLKK